MAIDAPLPELRPGPVRKLLKIAPGEMWCCDCGQDTPSSGMGHSDREMDRECLHCGSTRLVQAAGCLEPDEYYIAA